MAKSVSLPRLEKLRGAELVRALNSMTDDELALMAQDVMMALQEDVRENAIAYYRPVSKKARKIHKSQARIVGIGGGNGSSKTETVLAHFTAMATGVFPSDPDDPALYEDFKRQFRGPINARIVVQSLTTTLHPIILPKLKWWVWTGIGKPGGDKGHWGWVPKKCLINADWDKSWSEKLRILKVNCYEPGTEKVIGQSTIQFMSHDQEPQDFASGDFHLVMMDEPPRLRIWEENEARTMRIAGRMFMAMTWPDDPTVPVDWIFDKIVDRAGEDQINDEIVWFELHTIDNRHLDQEAIRKQMAQWDETTRQLRIFGRPIRFSNLIHPDFTDRDKGWCFDCKGPTLIDKDEQNDIEFCPACGNANVATYNHVSDFTVPKNWPVVFLLDPHPRKPHMGLWVAIDPQDDWWVVDYIKAAKEPTLFCEAVRRKEKELNLNVVQRLMDPNMGMTKPGVRRDNTWQEEFGLGGFNFELADDSGVGRERVNELLRPDPFTLGPRIHFHERCTGAGSPVFQMRRYVWDEHKRADQKDVKQIPKPKDDDFPTLLKYLANSDPQFKVLKGGTHTVVRTWTPGVARKQRRRY